MTGMRGVQYVPWSEDEKAMLRSLQANGLSYGKMAQMMGRSLFSVQRQLRAMGLTKADRSVSHVRYRRAAPEPVRSPKSTLPPLASLAEDAT